MPIYTAEIDPLFSQRHLGTLLKDQIAKMENQVDELADDYFLQLPPDDLIEKISEDAYLPPLQLHRDRGISHSPVAVNSIVVGTVVLEAFRYSVEIPYTGASGLFNHQPDTHDLDKPPAKLNSHSYEGSIILSKYVVGDVTEEELKAAFNADLAKVEKTMKRRHPFTQNNTIGSTVFTGSCRNLVVGTLAQTSVVPSCHRPTVYDPKPTLPGTSSVHSTRTCRDGVAPLRVR